MAKHAQADERKELAQSRTGVILVGGAGSNIARDLITEVKPAEYPNFNLKAENTDARLHRVHFPPDDPDVMAWKEANAFDDYILGESMTEGEGAGTNPDIGRQAVETEESKKVNTDFIKANDNIILGTGLGGGTGTGASPVIAKMCKDLEKPAIAIAMMPDVRSEGKKRFKRAVAAVEEIRKHVPTIEVSNSYIREYITQVLSTEKGKEDLARMLGPDKKVEDLTKKDVFTLVNHYSILPTIFFLRELLQVPGEVTSSDRANWKTFLTYGKHLFIGWKELDPATLSQTTEKEIVDDLWVGHFQNRAIAANGKAMIFLAHGPIPFLKTEAVKVELINRICGRDEARAEDFEVIENATERVADGKMWIAACIIAENVPIASHTERMDVNTPKGMINFPVFGESEERAVSLDLAHRFNRLYTSVHATVELLEPILDEVERETGDRPDMPPRLRKTPFQRIG